MYGTEKLPGVTGAYMGIDEIYISLTASNNHSDKGTVEEKDPYTKSTDIKSMKYSILVNKK